jgi:crotonobetainyl-CoA:carnitine CoA-transferase CaiB-like acyl-CoA transferase
MAVDQAEGPLAGLLVADFSRILAGPYATMLLADMGAEVVKVEGPGGDDTRTWQPPVRDGISTYYLSVNRNKRSVALDLRDADDLAAAHELARRADVFVENFKPGGLARFGLDYDSVSAANPAIVYASISGFGSGPKGAALPGYDLIVQATSGLMSVTGDPEGEPYRAGVAVFDVISGLHATIGVLAALNHRHETGRGQHVEISLLASAMSGLVNQTGAFVAGGVVPFRMGNSHPSLFPYEPLPCSDGELIITAGNDIQFRKLAEALGLPELPDDPRFGRNEDRTANRDQLRPLLVERLQTRPKMEWFRELTAAGVPCGPINTIDQGWRSPTRWGSTRSSSWARATRQSRRCATRSGSPRPRPATGCRRRPWTSTARRSAAGWPNRRRRHERFGGTVLPHLARHLDRRPDQAARPGPDRRPDGQGQLRRARLLAGHAAAADPVRDPGVRGGAGGAGRPRVHPDRDRRAGHLPVRPGLAAGGAGRRAARRRVPVPRRDRGLRALPARRALGAGRHVAVHRRGLGRGRAFGCRADQGGRALRPWARAPGAQGDRPAHAGADPGSPRKRTCAGRTCGCSRRSAGCTSRCSGAGCR